MKKYFLLIILSFSLYSCDYFVSDNPANISEIELNISDLQVLPDTLVYAGWITAENGAYFKIFESNADQSGAITIKKTVDFGAIQKGNAFDVTIEEKSDTLSKKGNVILSGRFATRAAKLQIGAEEIDFSTSLGVFSITTPTNITDNDLSGIWFVDDASSPKQGLDLPEIQHNGWIYNGRVEINGIPVSTGRFTAPDKSDDFSEYGDNLLLSLPFPGEDFLKNAPSGLIFPADLSNAKVMISLELNIAGKSSGFVWMNILEGVVPATVQANTTYPLQLSSHNKMPSGSVKVSVDLVE